MELERPKDPVRTRILAISGYVSQLRPGERAQLRRLRPSDDYVPPEVFWRIVDRYGSSLTGSLSGAS